MNLRACGKCKTGDHRICTGRYVNPAGKAVDCLCNSAPCLKRRAVRDRIDSTMAHLTAASIAVDAKPSLGQDERNVVRRHISNAMIVVCNPEQPEVWPALPKDE